MILRDFKPEDINDIVRLANNAKVAKYLASRFPHPYTHKDAEWWINTGSKIGINKVIEEDGKFAGVVGVESGEKEKAHVGEIGYWLGEEFWGRGIACKAVKQMTDLVFAETNIVRLYAPVFSPNLASMKVLKKCGYQQEGVFKNAVYKNGGYMDEHVFAILKNV